ncbi:MAG TPA: hypothetical protein VMF59_03075, partial [Bacteroidota bacterium]|nr:hypothetical protein [Bacteroidota bacterium]
MTHLALTRSYLILAVGAALSSVRPDTTALARSRADSTAHRRGAPYIRKAEQRGRIAVWIVDGTYVRTNIDEEFTNYGQHYGFDFIPANEFWIDREGKPDE